MPPDYVHEWPMLIFFFKDAFNVQQDVLLLAAKIALTAGPAVDTFTLEDIRL
jgi:hypothetical protein